MEMNNYIKPLMIGTVKVKNNIFLAPMAGITDIVFRNIARKFDVGLTFTEMISSKAMQYGSTKTEKMMDILDEERPCAVQIFGSDKDVICNMIRILNGNPKVDIIDINMGCPAPKIVKNGDGAALLLHLDKVQDILESAVKVSTKPITVKTRKGFDHHKTTACEVAKIAENAGVSMITIHGRTREQYYQGKSDLEIIKQVKETVSIPVIGNGDIVDEASALAMFDYTKCDGIMVARGSLGNPWLFKSLLEGKQYTPTLTEKLNIMLQHIAIACQYEDEKTALLKLRKHMAWYLKGMDGSNQVKDTINTLTKAEEVKNTIIDYFNGLA